ncbi:amino acid ABC transporter substrate-binding protein [Marinobacter salinexigens]|uniref:Amino acid ABC transporter substrate-binding protein n=1 Tax=Marinobacter salinexigens TaxID=2919747 RepID=A0A5B0VNM6_9GAMM|nr:transporter substrate-binding domain-containing protein [Marinobacter salinexigens]KAA1176023.1 amino acid ABC transporter substrate-binding protein [Marinobacter salinexigens]
MFKRMTGSVFSPQWVLTAALFCAQVQPANANDHSTYRFCEVAWPPYTMGKAGHSPTEGIAVALFRELEYRTGFTFELMLAPWKRCLHWAKVGEFDGVMLLTHNLERAQYLVFPDPVHRAAKLIWSRRNGELDRSFASFEDFQGLRIGTVSGVNYGKAFDDAVENHHLTIDTGPDLISNLKRLDLGRVDIVVATQLTGEYALKDHPDLRARLEYAAGPFTTDPIFIGLSAVSPVIERYGELNAAIAAMREDGTLEKIFEPQWPLDPP